LGLKPALVAPPHICLLIFVPFDFLCSSSNINYGTSLVVPSKKREMEEKYFWAKVSN
jgi:hypothetical protein